MPWQLATVMPLDIDTETDNGDYQATLDRCLAEFGWTEKSKLQGKRIDGRYHGIAVGCYLEGGGSGPRENARLVLEADGAVVGLCRLVGARPGHRDDLRADRRRRAGHCRWTASAA